jgi:hypothetical protein
MSEVIEGAAEIEQAGSPEARLVQEAPLQTGPSGRLPTCSTRHSAQAPVGVANAHRRGTHGSRALAPQVIDRLDGNIQLSGKFGQRDVVPVSRL